jgi:hypothetical protein
MYVLRNDRRLMCRDTLPIYTLVMRKSVILYHYNDYGRFNLYTHTE